MVVLEIKLDNVCNTYIARVEWDLIVTVTVSLGDTNCQSLKQGKKIDKNPSLQESFACLAVFPSVSF